MHRNRLTLARCIRTPEPDDQSLAPTDVIVPIVDGVPLHEVLVGRFAGVDIAWVMPPSRHWLGEPLHGEAKRSVLLDGGCGIFECCGVAARIAVGPDHVVWSDFFARGRPALPGGLRFEFDRADYEAALSGIPDLPPSPWPAGDGDADAD